MLNKTAQPSRRPENVYYLWEFSHVNIFNRTTSGQVNFLSSFDYQGYLAPVVFEFLSQNEQFLNGLKLKRSEIVANSYTRFDTNLGADFPLNYIDSSLSNEAIQQILYKTNSKQLAYICWDNPSNWQIILYSKHHGKTNYQATENIETTKDRNPRVNYTSQAILKSIGKVLAHRDFALQTNLSTTWVFSGGLVRYLNQDFERFLGSFCDYYGDKFATSNQFLLDKQQLLPNLRAFSDDLLLNGFQEILLHYPLTYFVLDQIKSLQIMFDDESLAPKQLRISDQLSLKVEGSGHLANDVGLNFAPGLVWIRNRTIKTSGSTAQISLVNAGLSASTTQSLRIIPSQLLRFAIPRLSKWELPLPKSILSHQKQGSKLKLAEGETIRVPFKTLVHMPGVKSQELAILGAQQITVGTLMNSKPKLSLRAHTKYLAPQAGQVDLVNFAEGYLTIDSEESINMNLVPLLKADTQVLKLGSDTIELLVNSLVLPLQANQGKSKFGNLEYYHTAIEFNEHSNFTGAIVTLDFLPKLVELEQAILKGLDCLIYPADLALQSIINMLPKFINSAAMFGNADQINPVFARHLVAHNGQLTYLDSTNQVIKLLPLNYTPKFKLDTKLANSTLGLTRKGQAVVVVDSEHLFTEAKVIYQAENQLHLQDKSTKKIFQVSSENVTLNI